MGKFCGNANVNIAVLVPTEERVAGGITLPDREFATKEFPHSSSRVLLWSLLTVVRNTVRQLSRLVVQLQSKLINQVKPSFLRSYQGDFSLRST